MSQHDYVISNSSGAAVRADINDALGAIVTLNSGASEPTTTYAYQLWADTTNNALKLRNAANNAWITLRELDGTLLLENGTVSNPALAFADDPNTGIFSANDEELGIATNGIERVNWTSTGVVFNEGGADYDFRVEGDTEPNLFVIDAGNTTVTIGGATTFTSNVTLNAQGDLRFADSDSSNWVAFQAPATVASNVTWTLPSADGAANTVFTTNGSGTLSFSAVTSAMIADGTIVDGDISASAAISKSKLSLAGQIVDADISGSAAIAGTKITPNFGSQNLGALGTSYFGAALFTDIINATSGGGVAVGPNGCDAAAPSQVVIHGNRTGTDGTIVSIRQNGTQEGSISVSGTTVSFNGGHLSRWSQLPNNGPRIEILRGTVLTNLDEMCEWGDEDNEQLNRTKVSDIEGDPNVAGVFESWDDDDQEHTKDFYCAMTGDFIIRIAAGASVKRGDLLMSAGDGTAKPQEDDIIRSKTIAKVTSTHVTCTYADGSYCLPCVLMAC